MDAHVDASGDAGGREGNHLQGHEGGTEEHVLLEGGSPGQQRKDLQGTAAQGK